MTATHEAFTIPSTSEGLQEYSRSRQAKLTETRKAVSLLPVTDKTTTSSRIKTVPAGNLNDDQDTIPSRHSVIEALKPAGLQQKTGLAPTQPFASQKQDMRDFIAKKREIFLVMMTIDNKRQELARLQERAELREAAVVKGEQMLAEDAARFDAFLRENDEKLQQVKRAAEAELKLKQDKVAEIKRLTALAAVARSELNESEEQLEQCKGYKEFIDRVTPQDWFDQEQAKKDRAREAELAAWRGACQDLRERREAAQSAQASAQQEYANARTQQEAEAAEAQIAAHKAALAALMAEEEPPEPPPPPPDDEPKLFFTEPDQLLQIFARLEEENLFLIQASQEAEEGLEGARETLAHTQASMEAQAGTLAADVQELQETVAAASQRCMSLRADSQRLGTASAANKASARAWQSNTAGVDATSGTLVPPRTGSSSRPHTSAVGAGAPISPEAIAAKLQEVHTKCGYEGEGGLAPVQMLASLEARLEELLLASEQLTSEAVAAGQHAREMERRKVLREEKALQQAAEHEDRVRRARERAEAPIFKKTGKPLMERSILPQHVKTKKLTAKDLENLELDRYLAQDLSQL